MQEVFDKFYKMKDELVTSVKESFGKQLADIFAKLPESINSIGFTQYTPYFCDGDPCEFSVHCYSDSLHINGEYTEYDKYVDFENPLQEFCNRINSIPKEILQDVLDEGLVTVHRDGTVTVEDYEHD